MARIKNIRTVNDYIERVQKQYPYFTNNDIKKILNFGLYMYFYAIRQHCDVVMNKDILRDSITTTTGLIPANFEKFWYRWHTKWRMKERLIYKLQGKTWDGYYYFGLTEDENKAFVKQGRRKTLKNKYLTKIKNEYHHCRTIKHIWRIPWPKDSGWRFWLDSFTSNRYEYVCYNEYTDYHQWTRKEENADTNQSVQSGTDNGSAPASSE